MKNCLSTLTMITALIFLPATMATPLTVGSSDNIQRVLETQKGKRLTVKLSSGDELTGIVKSVSSHVVHLGQLSGKEFYDAVIDTNAIAAVIIRTK